jgi:hypothetical protein
MATAIEVFDGDRFLRGASNTGDWSGKTRRGKTFTNTGKMLSTGQTTETAF